MDNSHNLTSTVNDDLLHFYIGGPFEVSIDVNFDPLQYFGVMANQGYQLVG
jgi:hypothetical protein